MAELEKFEDDEVLLSDDLMPSNQGSDMFDPLPKTDPDQDLMEKSEKAMILGATPLLDEIFKWLDFAIEDCDSINHIDPKLTISMEAQLYGMKHAKTKLVTARARLNTLKEQYIKDSSQ